MRKYRAAVVGLSGIGRGVPHTAPHPSLGQAMAYSHVSAYASVPETELVAVCDINPAAIDAFKRDWGARFPEAQTFTDAREMLHAVQPDLVSVVLPDHLHADVFLDSVAAGVKGIYCEKPIATTIADARRMMVAARNANVKVAVNHTRRWHPTFIKAREVIKTGEIGDVLFISGTLGGPRSMLFRNGTHLLDALLFLSLDRQPEWVIAKLGDRYESYGPVYAGDGGHDPVTDPDGNILIGFADGVRAVYNGVRNSAILLECEVQGTKGRLRLLNDRSGRLVEARLERLDSAGIPVVSNLPYEFHTAGHMQAAVNDLIRAIEMDTETLSPPEAALNTLSIMLAALQSNHLSSALVRFPVEDFSQDRQAA